MFCLTKTTHKKCTWRTNCATYSDLKQPRVVLLLIRKQPSKLIFSIHYHNTTIRNIKQQTVIHPAPQENEKTPKVMQPSTIQYYQHLVCIVATKCFITFHIWHNSAIKIKKHWCEYVAVWVTCPVIVETKFLLQHNPPTSLQTMICEQGTFQSLTWLWFPVFASLQTCIVFVDLKHTIKAVIQKLHTNNCAYM